MGRHSGFIALHAGLAARHADIVLLPEMTISHWDRGQRSAVEFIGISLSTQFLYVFFFFEWGF